MKALQNTCSGLFIAAVFVLSIVSIMGVWGIFGHDVIVKSFETITLLAVAAIVIIIAGKFVDHTAEDPMKNASTAAAFKVIRNSTLGVLIVSAALFVLLGLLAIWDVIKNSDVIFKSLSSLGILAFASLISVMVCLERENRLLGKPENKAVSGWTIFLVFIAFWTVMSFASSLFGHHY